MRSGTTAAYCELVHIPPVSPGGPIAATMPKRLLYFRAQTMKRHVVWLSIVGCLAGFGASSVESRQGASPARTRIDVSKLGPQVGDQVPDFTLKDQNGRTQTLKSIMGPKGAMLVFIRSADW